MTEYGRMDPFSFAGSKDVGHPVSIRIMNLEGDEAPFRFSSLLDRPDLRHVGSNTSPNSDLFVTVQVWAGSKPLTVPVQTAYRPFRSERKWNEWLELPITYDSLPADSTLAITIWDLSPVGGKDAIGHAVPFGGTTLPLFDDDNQVQKGRQKCMVHRHKKADGMNNSTTPALVMSKKGNTRKDNNATSILDRDAEELDRMEKLFKKHEMGEIPRVDWLDQMVFRSFEKRGLQAAKSSMKMLQRQRILNGDSTDAGDSADGRPGQSTFLINVELPRFDFPVVFADHEYEPPPISALQSLSASQANLSQRRQPQVQFGPGIKGWEDGSEGLSNPLIKVYDPEAGHRDNPAEAKHRRLFRSSHRHGILDKDLKPNAKVRDELNLIMSYSPTHVLSPEETDLVWKFRYHLTRDKRAATKFVKSVNWADQRESKQAIQVLGRWTAIDVDDALELLGPSFDNPGVRSYAVERLRKADDDELLLYLLQLVQALKYEHVSAGSEQDITQDSSLARFLIQRAAANFMLGNYFYWYLMVECDDRSPLQGDDNREVYRKVAYEFVLDLEKQPGGSQSRKMLLRQAETVAVLSKIASEVKATSESIAKKAERVKHFIADPKNELTTFDPPLAMPLDPSVKVTGIVPDQVTVFKSSLNPIKFTFKTTTGSTYPIIFKLGDDLRQDQLVIQIITLMDQLLQKENLDLKLSPYKILATSTSAGASQFVQSQSLSSIVSRFKNNPALAFLRHHNPDDRQPLGVRQETIDTYVRSCAGYCVITYILGVGDRHLDNLLLSPDGHFFHADFGFILGRDPKPFAPAMKLSKEMVDCMGGVQSEHYRQFRQYCFLAYTALRKSSNLILNLFSLMVDANIPDIRIEPDKAVLKVRERFHLELSEEEAILYFGRVIEDTLSAFAPVVLDKLHEWAQAFRT
ncbi:Phosphatidylinositol 3-kinase catalytic subunit type-like protein [Hapsidospora chrysogenum ATCC 11550]|uniref:Phosphatidylinositol 3-kinase VPS34 n=1 Tax=Hapsidospora chrysogenum (strain ATCC 11550 / CBS 779.69 / DSM 880 / IAM 14645 / JCM 23072 / IMI 49137) TaxID=857340 RepID=A0A086T9Z9_HAPC1|nr:Phosphatidylinositol 3-kinase catalytic subunit type-like protein [Hapsidospora chrysogenum ATCC 11550]